MRGLCRCYRGWMGADCSHVHPLGAPLPQPLPDGYTADDEQARKPVEPCLGVGLTGQPRWLLHAHSAVLRW
jgi:hypothetical protein